MGLVGLRLAATLAVTAARNVSVRRLLTAAAAGGLALLPSFVGPYFAGSAVGAAMTSLVGNPPVDGADTDLSIAFAGVVVGLLLASVSHVVTRSAPPPNSLSPTPAPPSRSANGPSSPALERPDPIRSSAVAGPLQATRSRCRRRATRRPTDDRSYP
jgi:hypothetical protein